MSADSSDDAGTLPAAGGEADPKEVLAWQLSSLLKGLGMNQSQFAARYHYDKSIVSRCLHGKRVPDPAFIESVFAAVTEQRGAPVTDELRAHIHRLYLRVLEAEHPLRHKIQLLTDQLEQAGQQAEAVRLHERQLGEQLQRLQQRVEELDDQLRQANEASTAERVRSEAELASHREARHRLESERDELLQRIAELEAQLRDVREQRQRAESDFVRLGRELLLAQRAETASWTEQPSPTQASSTAPYTGLARPSRAPQPQLVETGPGQGTGFVALRMFLATATATMCGIAFETNRSSGLPQNALLVAPVLGLIEGCLFGLCLTPFVWPGRYQLMRLIIVDVIYCLALIVAAAVEVRILATALEVALFGTMAVLAMDFCIYAGYELRSPVQSLFGGFAPLRDGDLVTLGGGAIGAVLGICSGVTVSSATHLGSIAGILEGIGLLASLSGWLVATSTVTIQRRL